MSNNNPLTEIGAIVLAGLLVIAAGLLMWAGKISFTDASLMLTFALALFGGNLALKAPSPAQQAQLQQLTSQALSVLPAVVAQAKPEASPVQPPVGQVPLSELKLQPGQTVQAPIPPSPIDPGVSMAAFSTSQMPAVTPPVQP